MDPSVSHSKQKKNVVDRGYKNQKLLLEVPPGEKGRESRPVRAY